MGCYANQKTTLFGTTTANRNQPELENLIGFFVNTLVLNIHVEPNQILADYFKKVSIEIIDAQSNQIPFEKLVKLLEIEKDTGRHPIFQVIFNYVNEQMRYDENLVFTEYDHGSIKKTAIFDMEIFINRTSPNIFGSFFFYTKLFHRESIQGFLATYKFLLKQLAELQASKNFGQLLLGETKWIDSTQESQLKIWKDEKGIKPGSNTTLNELFENIAEEFSSKTAVVCGERSLTYQELNEQSNRLAHYLRQSVNLSKSIS